MLRNAAFCLLAGFAAIAFASLAACAPYQGERRLSSAPGAGFASAAVVAGVSAAAPSPTSPTDTSPATSASTPTPTATPHGHQEAPDGSGDTPNPAGEGEASAGHPQRPSGTYLEHRLVVGHDDGVPGALTAAVASYAAELGLEHDLVRADPRGAAASLHLSTVLPPDGYEAFEVGRLRWVPVVHFSRWERSLTLEVLGDILEGRIQDWSEFGNEAGAVELVLDRESAPLVLRALGVPDAKLQLESDSNARSRQPSGRTARLLVLQTPEQVVEHVSTHRQALGVVPLDATSFEVRALSMSGCDPFRGSPACWPLATSIWLGMRSGALPDEMIVELHDRLVAVGARLTPDVAVLTAVGDVILGRKVDERMAKYRDYLSPFRDVAAELSAADVAVANLETPLSDRVVPSHDPKTLAFATSTRAIPGLRLAGIDAVSLANNHSLNCGPEPFVDTLAALESAGVKHFGGGRTREDARRPAIVEARGLRFAFLGYDDVAGRYYAAGERTPGIAPLDLPEVVADVRAARQVADVVVPYFHWGTEYTSVPTQRQREVAHAAVDAGAALVLGSHPHWVQAVEFHRGAFIAYSLGNFVFDQDWSTETQQGVILKTTWLNGRLVAVDFLPVRIFDQHRPRILAADSGEGREIIQRIIRASGANFRASR